MMMMMMKTTTMMTSIAVLIIVIVFLSSHHHSLPHIYKKEFDLDSQNFRHQPLTIPQLLQL
jgi:hypothetical protein